MLRIIRTLALVVALIAATAAFTPSGITSYCATRNTPSCAKWWASMPPVAPGTWTQDFADEFNGTALSAATWSPSWFGTVDGYSHPVNSLEDGCFDTRLVSVSNGALNLGSGTTSDSDCRKRNGATTPYRGSIVSSNGKYAARTGYYEARVYYPGPNSCDAYNWPVFWTNGQSWPGDGEFDIAEVSSDHKVKWHYHSNAATDDGAGFCGEGWHTYGMRCTASTSTFTPS